MNTWASGENAGADSAGLGQGLSLRFSSSPGGASAPGPQTAPGAALVQEAAP